MASKVYTAQEMRQRADEEERHWHDHVTAAMLRQAADALERKEREKKYEYAKVFFDGTVSSRHHESPEEIAAKDAEIASLHETIKRLEHENSVFFIDVDHLRALVKELADALDRRVFCRQNCTGCKVGNGDNIRCASKVDRSLITKAREVCK